jgi:hypothetical protein
LELKCRARCGLVDHAQGIQNNLQCPSIVQEQREKQVKAQSLRRVQVMKIRVQLDAPTFKPTPKFIPDGSEDVQFSLSNGKNVGIRLAVLEPNSVFIDAKHLALVGGEVRFRLFLKLILRAQR